MTAMWRKAVLGVVLLEMDGLDIFRCKANKSTPAYIAGYVADAIGDLVWQYRVPMQIQATAVEILCLCLTFRTLNTLGPAGRRRVLNIARVVPRIGLFRKYVRAMALLVLFDSPGVRGSVSRVGDGDAP